MDRRTARRRPGRGVGVVLVRARRAQQLRQQDHAAAAVRLAAAPHPARLHRQHAVRLPQRQARRPDQGARGRRPGATAQGARRTRPVRPGRTVGPGTHHLEDHGLVPRRLDPRGRVRAQRLPRQPDLRGHCRHAAVPDRRPRHQERAQCRAVPVPPRRVRACAARSEGAGRGRSGGRRDPAGFRDRPGPGRHARIHCGRRREESAGHDAARQAREDRGAHGRGAPGFRHSCRGTRRQRSDSGLPGDDQAVR